MFGFLKKDPVAKIQKKIDKLGDTAVQYQRNGKLREYAEAMEQVAALEKEIATLKSAKNQNS